MQEKLLKAYNDYIEVEFQERRNTTLDIKLGLMYTTDEDSDDEMEFYYDTQLKTFFGIVDDRIVFEESADFERAIKVIESNGFDDYYGLLKDIVDSNFEKVRRVELC